MSNTVFFCNNGKLDLVAATTMGVSVKSDSAIGYFGTGLKFSLATLLRNSCEVLIHVSSERHEVSVDPTTIREEMFDIVTVDGVRTGFTTALGRNWQMWQAYRELASNAMDEAEYTITTDAATADNYDTIIAVTGDSIMDAYSDHDNIFCHNRKILHETPRMRVRAGESQHIFYRGVRIHTCESIQPVTYEILESTTLTEDRTMAFPHILPMHLGMCMAHCEDEDLIERFMLKPSELEKIAQFSNVSSPSEEFMRVMYRNRNNLKVNQQARELWRRVSGDDKPETINLNERQQEVLALARERCLEVDDNYTESIDHPVLFVRSLGPDILGCVRSGQVYIAQNTIDQGVNRLASTLYEEYLHAFVDLEDETRTMQNYLLDRLFA